MTGLRHEEPESLFERFSWLYAFCREHLFRDDTERIAETLWAGGVPPEGSRLLELGCGPGFYARRLAAHFANIEVMGIDNSESLLQNAALRANAHGLENCRFEKGDVCELTLCSASADALISSRLFTVLPGREKALSEMHRVLKPGGHCFIAEPRSVLRAAVPLVTMRLLAGFSSLLWENPHSAYCEPGHITIMSAGEFDGLLASQPWKSVRRWQDFWYQYAVCRKGGA